MGELFEISVFGECTISDKKNETKQKYFSQQLSEGNILHTNIDKNTRKHFINYPVIDRVHA